MTDVPDVRPAAPAAPMGHLTFDSSSHAWDWDAEVYRIVGVEPGSAPPSSALVLACADPEERSRILDELVRAAATGEPLRVFYRALAADGVERSLLLLCEGRPPAEGELGTRIDGVLVDLTPDFLAHSVEVARQAVAASAENRATIERAVGVMMVAYGLDASQAFEMLSWWSQNTNVKVRVLAARLLDEATRGLATDLSVRRMFDALLHDATRPGPDAGARTEE